VNGGEEEHMLSVGKPEAMRPLGRPRHRWVDNIELYIGKKGWSGVDCTDLTKDRNKWRALVTAVMNLQVP
jgi:hypothetical protein